MKGRQTSVLAGSAIRFGVMISVVAALLIIWYASAVSPTPSENAYRLRYDFQTPAPQTESQHLEPEAFLKEIQERLFRSEYQQALDLVERMVAAYPNFQVGQWLYAELLTLAAEPLQSSSAEGVVLPTGKGSTPALADFHTELSRRLKASQNKPPSQAVPRGLGHLSPSTRYLAVVDASTSRLYFFKNRSLEGQPPQLELLFDSYASVGLNGILKQKEGDGRSPLGVYFTQKTIPDQRLPDLYGAGALTLNYPNMLDVHRGRSGSGIWIHGTPSAQYSRAPQASDGCIVLPNDSMSRLLALDNPRGVPILIQDKIDWVPAEQAAQLPASLLQQVAARYPHVWPEGWSSVSIETLRARLLHFFSWQDHGQPVALIDLTLPTGTGLRSYWVLNQTQWQFVSESRL